MQVWLAKKDNIIMVVGNATKTPELKKIGQWDTLKASFSLAYKKDDGSSVYCNCAAFGRIADYACNIEKGSVVCAIGKVESRSYTGKDGTPKTWTEIVIKWMNILGEEPSYLPEGFEPPSVGSNAEPEKTSPVASQPAQSEGYVDVEPEDGEDLPF